MIPRQPRPRLTIAAVSLALIAAACSGTVGSGDEPDARAPEIANTEPTGPAVPSTEFVLFDGATSSLAAFNGSPVVLNFWASWCPSCVAEMSRAFRPAQETYGSDVTFIGMNIQDQRVLADELLAETGVQWLNAEDQTGALYRDLGGLGMPFTVFISASGTIVDVHNGPLNEAQLAERITTDLLG